MIGGIDSKCGTEPAANDPALWLPGTAAPATRCHRDAWAETQACNFDHYEYAPDGSGGWNPVKVYSKTEIVKGWNINQVFTPTYAQLVDTTAYPAGTTRPPAPPAWAPQTNPSTFMTTDCATNAGGPTGVTLNPPPTVTATTTYGSCPAGYTGSISYLTVHTLYWTVGASPADTYDGPTANGDTCVVAPGQTVNTSTGQQCTPGRWVPYYVATDTGGSQNTWQVGWYWWSGNLAYWDNYGPGQGIPWVANTCPPTGPAPDGYCQGEESVCMSTALVGAGYAFDQTGGAKAGYQVDPITGAISYGWGTERSLTQAQTLSDAIKSQTQPNNGGGFGSGTDSHNNGLGGTDGGGLGPV